MQTFDSSSLRSALCTALFVGLGLGAAAAPLAGQEEAATESSGPLTIAVINLDRITLESPAGVELAEALQALQNSYDQQAVALEQAVTEAEARAADSPADPTPEETRIIERDLQDALTALQRFRQDTQSQADQIRAEGIERIRNSVLPILEDIQSERNYDLILSGGTATVLVHSDRVDLTDDALERMRAATQSPPG